MKKIFARRTVSEHIVFSIVFVLFLVMAASYVFVLVWAMLAGMRTHSDVTLRPFENILKNLDFLKPFQVFGAMKVGKAGFGQMLLTSIYFSVLGTILTILSTSMIAYVTTKYKFPCHKWFYYIVLVTMILPLYGTAGSTYRLYNDLGLLNSPLMIITSLGGLGGNFLYFEAFYRGFSDTYMEAAEIDGANEWQIFFKVVFPQSMGITGALFLTSWVVQWNAYDSVLLYLPKLPTLAAGLYKFNAVATSKAKMDLFFAACVITAIPPLVLFAVFNKVLTSNVSLGGIKE